MGAKRWRRRNSRQVLAYQKGGAGWGWGLAAVERAMPRQMLREQKGGGGGGEVGVHWRGRGGRWRGRMPQQMLGEQKGAHVLVL